MLAELGPEKFNEWIAYHRLEPWGDECVQTAQIISAIVNAGGGKSTPLDFLPGEHEHAGTVKDFARKYEAK